MKPLNQLFEEIESHLMHDKTPSQFLNIVADNPLFQLYPFDMIYKLKTVKQSPTHHPEGNVWNHTMLVVDEAAKVKYKSKNMRVFMWSALLHDVGKYSTTKIRKGRITSYNHEKAGANLVEKFLTEFTDDKEFISNVAALVRWHMQILYVVNNLPFAAIPEMKEQVDINEIALLGKCDRLGRLNADIEKENKVIELFIQKCKSNNY
ncbi:MAG: HD domain-containing protein [Clostridia bacterium]|jgi:putative nucleotidyltransferase with HDIG domain|nr:HD domain-containing protein [Clostridia bacterium]MCI2013922.1 HD domain-containing protein [Clostridia bacterium]